MLVMLMFININVQQMLSLCVFYEIVFSSILSIKVHALSTI